MSQRTWKSPPRSLAAATGTFFQVFAGATASCFLLSAPVDTEAAETFGTRNLALDPYEQATQGGFAATDIRSGSDVNNPALAAGFQRPTASFSHLSWAGDLSREWASVATPLTSRFGFGANLGFAHGPSLPGYDEAGISTGAFSVSEWSLGLSLGAHLGHGLTLGLGSRYFRLEDPTSPIGALGGSAGLRWSDGQWAVGAAVTDVQVASFESETGTASGEWDLPTRVRGDVEGWVLPAFRVGVGAELGADESLFHLGTELRTRPWLSLLGGIAASSGGVESDFDWSAGLRAEHAGVRVAYAFRSEAELGDLHQFGLEIPLRPDRGRWAGPSKDTVSTP